MRSACDLLAPATRERLERTADRPAALAALAARGAPADARVERVEVWGDRAQARSPRDTVFVLDTPAGWRITAAGCRSRGEAPYDCALEGP